MKDKIDLKLLKLSKSKFRSSFHLNNKMIEYVSTKGIDKIKKDAYELLEKRLKPAFIPNDGKQTPMRQVHPVFIAQHACACCCRGCLLKWYNIPKERELSKDEIDYIVSILISWILKECKKSNENIKK
jgi:exodeoxyribonuclease V alpha subunit